MEDAPHRVLRHVLACCDRCTLSTTDLDIRQFTVDDVPALAEIEYSQEIKQGWGLPNIPRDTWESETREAISHWMRDGAIVCRATNRLIGRVTLQPYTASFHDLGHSVALLEVSIFLSKPGGGLGTQIVRALAEHLARLENGSLTWLCARLHRAHQRPAGFLTRSGFSFWATDDDGQDWWRIRVGEPD